MTPCSVCRRQRSPPWLSSDWLPKTSTLPRRPRPCARPPACRNNDVCERLGGGRHKPVDGPRAEQRFFRPADVNTRISHRDCGARRLRPSDNGGDQADERDDADNDGGHRPVLREVLERIAKDLTVIEVPRQGEGHPPQLTYCEH